jgi:hypothetical protein
MASKMKKLALLSIAVSQGQTITNSKVSSKKKREYLKEMNRISKQNQRKDALNILKKYRRTRTKR